MSVRATPVLAAGLLALLCGTAIADPPVPGTRDGILVERPGALTASALREREIAEIHVRLYERVDYPLRLRALESEIKLAESDVELHRRLVDQYSRFDRARNRSGFVWLHREEARRDLLDSELRLRDLKEERFLMQRHHQEQRRLNHLLLERVRAQTEPDRPGELEPIIVVGSERELIETPLQSDPSSDQP